MRGRVGSGEEGCAIVAVTVAVDPDGFVEGMRVQSPCGLGRLDTPLTCFIE